MKDYRYGKRLYVLLLAVFLILGNLTADNITAAAAAKRTLNVTDISLNTGQSYNLKVSGKGRVKWSSSNKNVVNVSKKGKITARKKGSATIKAKISGRTLKCNVVVNSRDKDKKDILIVYFSKSGTTKQVASRLRKLTGGDMLRIQEKKRYTADYDRLTTQAKKELKQKKKIASTTMAKNIRSYDVIYVGYPIWWHSTPRIINTFLEQYNLNGKTVIPFCTSGGSDISESMSTFKKSAKGAVFKTGYTADEGTEAEIKKWLTDIGEFSDGDDENTSDKVLVAYFSHTGNSKADAEAIAGQTGGKLYRIERQTAYAEGYGAGDEAKAEWENDVRPPLKNPLSKKEMAGYNKVILCYPIWWHTAPMVVGTFLEQYDWSGKMIYPVSQSASMDQSYYDDSVKFIKRCAPAASVDEGIYSTDSDKIADYISKKVLK